VITVDTSVAHLAGALGKPVWVLNRRCWRWLRGREHTRGTRRYACLRNPSPSIIDRVATELRLFAAGDRSPCAASSP
jgi:hypothetical protein